ncbi:MAG TPA: sulfatase-like hydrolase/transferase [Deltaproteobacteria bacterium]|nr:sulfatase-like hydrolase/transferase [Deltaproteobacteria bacterium]
MYVTSHERNALRTRLKAVFWFLLFNFFLSVCLGYAYIVFMPGIEGLLSTLFVHGALVSNTAMIYVALGLVFVLCSLVLRRTSVLLGVMVVAVTFLHMLNVLDIIIFHIFRYHINAMVVTLVFTEGARDSLHIGVGTVLTYAAGIGGVVALEVYLAYIAVETLAFKPFTKKAAVIVMTLALLVIAAEKSAYALADLYNVKDVTRYNKLFPLYQRATIKHFARKHLGVKTDPDDTLAVRHKGNALLYPKEPMVREPIGKLPNIVWIVVDAWRFDMLTEDVAPNMLKFSQKTLVFRNHYSGGNATRFGVFTLVYGVYGSYWQSFLAEQQSPVLLDELMKLGYDFRIISSSKLTNPEFRRTAFVKLGPYITDTLPGTMADKRDPELAETFIDWLGKRDAKKPFYAFLFFDAPHGPYIYPDEYEKFKPSNKSPNYVTAGKKEAGPLYNSYRNAIYFDDHLVGKVLDEMEKKGLMENTVILITGDHGEEFYETGFWGHTSAFSKYQSRVSFVLYVPGRGHGVVEYPTSHLDVAPTFLKMLGYKTPYGAYSQGGDMLEPGGLPYKVVSGWNEAAIIDREYTVVMPTESYMAGSSEVRFTESYKRVADERAVIKGKRGEILEVVKGMSVFLR